MLDVKDTNISGIEVPIETIVRPTKISGIPNFLAIPDAPSTKKSAPLIKNKKPIIIKIILFIIFKSFPSLFKKMPQVLIF
jgi:hypothetical protein